MAYNLATKALRHGEKKLFLLTNMETNDILFLINKAEAIRFSPDRLSDGLITNVLTLILERVVQPVFLFVLGGVC